MANHIRVGDLGDDEILLLAYDDGDVIAYYTRSIAAHIGRQLRGEYKHDRLDVKAAKPQVPGTGSAPAVAPGVATGFGASRMPRPFFQENVGRSAWGLAIHKKSRIIAVGSNSHNVTVFAPGLSEAGQTIGRRGDGTVPSRQKDASTEDATLDELEAYLGLGSPVGRAKQRSGSEYHLPSPNLSKEQREEMRRTRSGNLRIRLKPKERQEMDNIPDVAFIDDEDGEAEIVLAIDVQGRLWAMNIWSFGQDGALCIPRSEDWDRRRANNRGWGVIVLPESSFMDSRGYEETLGGPPADVRLVYKTSKWIDTTLCLQRIPENLVGPQYGTVSPDNSEDDMDASILVPMRKVAARRVLKLKTWLKHDKEPPSHLPPVNTPFVPVALEPIDLPSIVGHFAADGAGTDEEENDEEDEEDENGQNAEDGGVDEEMGDDQADVDMEEIFAPDSEDDEEDEDDDANIELLEALTSQIDNEGMLNLPGALAAVTYPPAWSRQSRWSRLLNPWDAHSLHVFPVDPSTLPKLSALTYVEKEVIDRLGWRAPPPLLTGITKRRNDIPQEAVATRIFELSDDPILRRQDVIFGRVAQPRQHIERTGDFYIDAKGRPRDHEARVVAGILRSRERARSRALDQRPSQLRERLAKLAPHLRVLRTLEADVELLSLDANDVAVRAREVAVFWRPRNHRHVRMVLADEVDEASEAEEESAKWWAEHPDGVAGPEKTPHPPAEAPSSSTAFFTTSTVQVLGQGGVPLSLGAMGGLLPGPMGLPIPAGLPTNLHLPQFLINHMSVPTPPGSVPPALGPHPSVAAALGAISTSGGGTGNNSSNNDAATVSAAASLEIEMLNELIAESQTGDGGPLRRERLCMMHHIPELRLVVAGSQCGRVALITPTRPVHGPLAEPLPLPLCPKSEKWGRRRRGLDADRKRQESGETEKDEVLHYGFRVDAILPKKQDVMRKPVRPVHWLLGVAVGPVLGAETLPGERDAMGDVDMMDSADHCGFGTGEEKLDMRRASRRCKSPASRVYRLMLHFRDHRVLTYELSRNEETDELMVL